MKKISDLLTRLGSASNYKDKANKPSNLKCPYCDREVVHWWLESKCVDLFPSRWMPQLCICKHVYNLKAKVNEYLRIGRQEKAERVVRLIEALRLIATNEEFYRRRIEFADKVSSEDIWQWMFDCKDKGEALFETNLIKEEQNEITSCAV